MTRTSMRTWMLAVATCAACGGSPATIDAAGPPGDGGLDGAVDASSDGGPRDAGLPACDPSALPGHTGCGSGRCTWITVDGGPPATGMVGCVPAGTVGIGGACTVGPPGAATGYDDCQEGGVCIDGTCADVCSFLGGANGCGTAETCATYHGLFDDADGHPLAGVCRRGCDAVGQTDCPPTQGCYVLVSQFTSRTVCAAAGMLGQGQLIPGQVFANSCRAGYMPRRRDQDSTMMECGALCRPANVTMGMNEASEGGVEPDTCSARNAAVPADPQNGESCRFWWAREITPGSDYSNTIGWCFRHAAFRYDADGDGVLDTPHPRCIQVTTDDVLPPVQDPPVSDAEYFWCVGLPDLLARAPVAAPPAVRLDELAPPR
ncbi:MAG TPA: hypothetical protein VHE35_28410 [Kofleriaceae bacterium]|nr:hypothetical protein [Kofleriaceae bacterium]